MKRAIVIGLQWSALLFGASVATLATAGEPCVITCPANITAPNDPGQCGAVINYAAPTTFGDCGTVTCVPASGSFFGVAVSPTVVTCSEATNGATCSFTITVSDTEPPVVQPHASVTVTLPEGQTQTPVAYTASATDNCALDSLVVDPPSGSVFPLGESPVTATATDAAGNTATLTFLVIIYAIMLVPALGSPALILLALLLMGTVAYRQYRRR